MEIFSLPITRQNFKIPNKNVKYLVKHFKHAFICFMLVEKYVFGRGFFFSPFFLELN